MSYFRYSLGDLKASDKKFELIIGRSSFSTDGMNLDLEQGGDLISALISFRDT